MLPPSEWATMDDRRQFLLMDELGQVVDVARHRVVAGRRPGGIAMPAQVGGDDVVFVAQCGGHPVPVAAVVAPAMQQQQRRRGRVAPVHVVQPQPLREIDAGRWDRQRSRRRLALLIAQGNRAAWPMLRQADKRLTPRRAGPVG